MRCVQVAEIPFNLQDSSQPLSPPDGANVLAGSTCFGVVVGARRAPALEAGEEARHATPWCWQHHILLSSSQCRRGVAPSTLQSKAAGRDVVVAAQPRPCFEQHQRCLSGGHVCSQVERPATQS